MTASFSYKREGREEEEANKQRKRRKNKQQKKRRKSKRKKPHLVTRSIPPAKRDTATLGSSLCLKTKSIIGKQNDKQMMSIFKIVDRTSYLSLRYFWSNVANFNWKSSTLLKQTPLNIEKKLLIFFFLHLKNSHRLSIRSSISGQKSRTKETRTYSFSS